MHGCALADTAGEILMFVEDVGRHNAVDAIAGCMWLDGDRRLRQGVLHHRPADLRDGDQVRADAHPVPRLALRASPRWATQIAQQVGITMLGRASGRHYLAFTGKERLRQVVAAADGARVSRSRDGKKSAEASSIRAGEQRQHQEHVAEAALACGAAARSAAPPPPPRRARRRSAPTSTRARYSSATYLPTMRVVERDLAEDRQHHERTPRRASASRQVRGEREQRDLQQRRRRSSAGSSRSGRSACPSAPARTPPSCRRSRPARRCRRWSA